MQHVGSLCLHCSTHAECIKSVVYIILSVDVPVLPYYILL